MAKAKLTNVQGLNLRLSPFQHSQLLRAVNITTNQIGAKEKRPGYGTYLGTADGEDVKTLFNWTLNNGTQFWNYRFSGSQLFYSTQGTGDWTVCGNGTFTGSYVGHAVLNEVLIAGDGAGSTRHTSDGTSFTNTTLAPVSEQFEEYQGRIYAIGTASNLFYSTVGTASDWSTDSSSILIPGAGKNNLLFKASDRLHIGKNSGLMFRWDGYSLVDLSTESNYSSPYSIGNIEGYRIGLNRLGFYGNGGDKPELLSNAIEKQIYNDEGNAIAGTTFDTAPGIFFKHDYLCSVGTISDDFTYGTVSNCIQKYDIQLNEWLNWSFANKPNAFGTYKDESGNLQLIWGDTAGQCYRLAGTALSDNGNPIETVMEGFIDGGSFEEKKWNWIRGVFNPNSRAKVQIALTNSLEHRTLKWQDLVIGNDGVAEMDFPAGARSRFCFWKIYESSTDSRFKFYGWEYSADIIKH